MIELRTDREELRRWIAGKHTLPSYKACASLLADCLADIDTLGAETVRLKRSLAGTQCALVKMRKVAQRRLDLLAQARAQQQG